MPLTSVCIWLATLLAQAEPAASSPLAANYGFLPVEVTKLEERTHSLISGDFNDDGRNDLVVVDNSHHHLLLLLQRAQQPEAAATPKERGINTVDNHWRFDVQKIPVDHDVVALARGDFNHDGRLDLAYFGTPDQLVIRYQTDDDHWSKHQKLRLSNVAAGQWCLAAGYLNDDDRTDLVLLGQNETLIFLQPENAEFQTPERLLNTSSKLGLVQASDLNDDGREDLCYLTGDAVNRQLGVRLQNDAGELGPEYLFDLARPRAVSVRDVDGDGAAEILVIDARTGRLKVLKLTQATADPGGLPERLVHFGFGKRGSGRDRDLALADFDGNGLLDVVVSDPEASRVLLFRQFPQRGLDLGRASPSLTGAGTLRTAAVSNQMQPGLFVQSTTEKSIGISHWEDGRLTFPQALPLELEPVAMEIISQRGDQQPQVLVVTREKESRTSQYSLVVFQQDVESGLWSLAPDVIAKSVATGSLKGAPEGILLADVTGDEQAEILILQGARPPLVLQRNAMGVWQDVPTTGSLSAASISPGAISPGRMGDTAGLLVSQDNHVRLLRLNAQQRWEVAEQVNAGEAGSKVVGAIQLDLDGQPGQELVMVDSGLKQLRVFRLEGQAYQPWKELELGEFDFKSTRVADLNQDGRDDLLLFGADQFAVLYAGASAPILEELASYESSLERSFPTDVFAGDLNGDGQTNLIVTDTRGHKVEVLEYRPPSQIERALYFTVFEEKGFAREEGTGVEPREGLVADVTGDGLDDLVLLAHNRILIYPQDSGRANTP